MGPVAREVKQRHPDEQQVGARDGLNVRPEDQPRKPGEAQHPHEHSSDKAGPLKDGRSDGVTHVKVKVWPPKALMLMPWEKAFKRHDQHEENDDCTKPFLIVP